MISPLIKKLMFVRQFSIDNGKIDVLGSKHIMLASDALLELQEIDNAKLYDLMKDSAFKQISKFVEHAKVYSSMKNALLLDVSVLSKKLGTGDEGLLKTLQDIFNIYGLGSLVIVSLDNDKKQASVRVMESSIAQAYRAKNKKSSAMPVCSITSGVLAGIFSYLFKKQVDAAESRCLAKGASFCEFLIK